MADDFRLDDDGTSNTDESGQTVAQRVRRLVHSFYGSSGNVINTSEINRAVRDNDDDFASQVGEPIRAMAPEPDKFAKLLGVVCGAGAAIGAAPETAGLGSIPAAIVGYKIGYNIGHIVTGRIEKMVNKNIDEAESF